MGFWKALGNMVQGKPVFEDPNATATVDVPPATTATTPSQQKTATQAPGTKIVPEVTLEHCKSHCTNLHMEVTAWATNRSELEIEIDSIVLANEKMNINRRLPANGSHEVRLYSGPIPMDDNAHMAHLSYKTIGAGDYFQADYVVEYHQESNGSFLVEDLHLERPIRDV